GGGFGLASRKLLYPPSCNRLTTSAKSPGSDPWLAQYAAGGAASIAGRPEPPLVHATGMRGRILSSDGSTSGVPCPATTRSASSIEKTPATHAAAYSPSPSPITAAGSTPNDFQS